MSRPQGVLKLIPKLIESKILIATYANINTSGIQGVIKIKIIFALYYITLFTWFNDDGEGIPKDKYEDVFKPFFTLDPSRNKLKGESGLGLTITRDIIRSHGGDVKLSESNLGGLQLKVLLPL